MSAQDHGTTFVGVILLINRLQRACGSLGENATSDDFATAPALWNLLPSLVAIGGQVCCGHRIHESGNNHFQHLARPWSAYSRVGAGRLHIWCAAVPLCTNRTNGFLVGGKQSLYTISLMSDYLNMHGW